MENTIHLSPVPYPDNRPRCTLADTPEPGAVRVALYIDADNQSPQSARALVELLRDGFGTRIACATIAGNSDGKVGAGWSAALREQIPDLPIDAIVVPCRKDAADAALILALGANLAEHLRDGTRVVMVSRDALLLAAAMRAQSVGCRIYAAYADCEIPTARNPALATLLLPAISGSDAPVKRLATAEVESKASVPIDAGQPQTEIAQVIAQVRAMCKQQPGGGYSATDVGQALVKIGYKTPSDRKRVIATFPGLREQGAHPHKLLVF